MDLKVRNNGYKVDLYVPYEEYYPYCSMVDDGDATAAEMQTAADHITATIIKAAASGDRFRDSYDRITKVLYSYGRLGFADSEGCAVVDDICRMIWGNEAKEWIG